MNWKVGHCVAERSLMTCYLMYSSETQAHSGSFQCMKSCSQTSGSGSEAMMKSLVVVVVLVV